VTRLEEIYDVETAAETGWQALFTAEGLVEPVHKQRDNDDLPLPRIDVQFVLGAHTGHWKHLAGAIYEDAWDYRLTFGLNSKLGDEGAHALLRARVRILAQYGKAKLTASLFPLHTFTQIVSAGSTPEFIVVDDCHLSELVFTGRISVRESAWSGV